MEDRLIRAYKISLLKEEKKFFDRYQTLEEMAAMYLINGNYYKAERNLRTSIEKKLDKVGEQGYILISPTLITADLKLQKGELKEADRYLGYDEAFVKLYFSKTSTSNADFLLLKSKYFLAISDYKKAKDTQNEAIDILAEIYGENHVRLAIMYAALAEILMKDKATNPYYANQMYEKALKIVADALGKNTPLYANLLVKQAELLLIINNYSIAETNLNEAEKFWVSKLGQDNAAVAEISLIKGKMNYLQSKYNEASVQYKRASQLYSSLFNKLHPGNLNANVGLAKVAYMQSDYNQAADVLKPILDARLKFIDNNFSIMSFGQKTSYWAGFRDEFELYNSIIYKQQLKQPKNERNAEMYNYTIRTKGLLLSSDAKLRRKVAASGDSSLTALYQEWLFQKEYYALISNFSNKQLEEEKVSAEDVALYIDDMEKQINAKTDNSLTNAKIHSWSEVKNSLPEKSTAVEMVRFRYFNQIFTDTIVYACLSVSATNSNGPEAIFTNEGKMMEGSYLNYYRNASINKLENENSFDSYLKPFLSIIHEGNTIFFSSEGVYNQINPEMLYNEATKKYALESNTFVFVSNTKDLITELVNKKQQKSLETTYYLYGNPKFYTQKLSRKDTVANLPGAEREIQEISEVLNKNARNNVKLLGAGVTEDTIKAVESPTVIHIATHGYFSESKEQDNAARNPMLNSGLMLTGSGNILANLENGYINQTSGMLTTSEVMELNFTNTNLVVLSACETGRGQVEVGEGVYGLQRAFLVAGAKAIILSLFKVDDDATRLLMVKFYEKSIQNGGDYRKAFREAKQDLRNSQAFEKPIYWGSFIMIEGQPQKIMKVN